MQLPRAAMALNVPCLRLRYGSVTGRVAAANNALHFTGPALRFFETSRSLQPARQVNAVVMPDRKGDCDAPVHFRYGRATRDCCRALSGRRRGQIARAEVQVIARLFQRQSGFWKL